MIIYVDKETKAIVDYSMTKNSIVDNCDYYEIDLIEDSINDDLLFCKFIDGEIVFDEELKLQVLMQRIRNNREIQCFSVINRGQLWYNHLTEEQLQELEIWYQAWLDAPQTLAEPERPNWIE